VADVAAAFILGCAVGLYVYRQGVISVLKRIPATKCDYCQFYMLMGKEPFPQKEKEGKEQ
jgi:hypothetical protein